ncbi:MAG: hypothetical protein ACHRXM_05000 [Isosphaerales bacterium]
MAITTKRGAVGVVWAIGIGAVLGLSVALVEVPAGAQEAPTFELQDFGVIPRPALQMVLLGMESVQKELKMTDAQKKEEQAIQERRFHKIRQARRDIKDIAKFRAARDAIINEIDAAIRANLKPEQRERLDQVQLQAQGPLAFARPDSGPMAFTGLPLTERLKLSDDQVRRARAIVEAGEKEIAKAASFPIVLDPKNGPPSAETVRKLVESPEFQAAKQKARQAGRDAWAAVIRRIEAVLTDTQRGAYHKLLGEAFDLTRLHEEGQDEPETDRRLAAAALGLGGGQRADPSFDVKVARPAYTQQHPRVMIDEAHHNFHTAGGRYKPFADLVANDGYRVSPNREKFTRQALEKCEILVIANALGPDGMDDREAAKPAFTEAECDAVRDWVNDGGSLLLITDHRPFGDAAETLSKRFGVEMSKGVTNDPENSEKDRPAELLFTRAKALLGDHPITRGRDDSERLNRIQTFAGQSLKGPANSTAILKLADTAIDKVGDKDVSAADRAQGVALGYGKGRVVVLGEAAELSAQMIGLEKFGMNVPGLDNRQMALNLMHWLSGLLERREGVRKKAG